MAVTMQGVTLRRSVAFATLLFSAASVIVWTSMGRLGLASAGRGDPWFGADAPGAGGHAVVVAELFTSEGCSSCPPADEVLSRLVRQPVDGNVVLGLGEHVDYWDHLGWRDPFASPAFSDRQAEYQRQVFRASSIYTPQLVVDGQFEAVGSDVSAIRRAIANAAKTPKAVLDVSASPAGDGQLSVNVRIDSSPAVAIRERADVIIALTQDHLTTDVRRGENGGRTLTHSAVVRSLTALGAIDPTLQTFNKTTTVPLARAWNVDDLSVVALLQERRSRRIVGAGSGHVKTSKLAASIVNGPFAQP